MDFSNLRCQLFTLFRLTDVVDFIASACLVRKPIAFFKVPPAGLDVDEDVTQIGHVSDQTLRLLLLWIEVVFNPVVWHQYRMGDTLYSALLELISGLPQPHPFRVASRHVVAVIVLEIVLGEQAPQLLDRRPPQLFEAGIPSTQSRCWVLS